MSIYVDTSFLVSLYSADVNSVAAVETMRISADELVISTLAELELVNAFELRVFRKEISRAQAKASMNDFEQDLRMAVLQLTALPDRAFARARKLAVQTTHRLGTRTADLLHVSAALELSAMGIYSFDKHQRKLAQAVKLKLNPFS